MITLCEQKKSNLDKLGDFINVALYSLLHAEEVSGIALINNVAPLLWSGVGIYGLARDPCFDTIWKVLPVLVVRV